MDQQQYVGLDVSLETTAVCVVDEAGTVIWRGKCASTPEGITAAVQTYAPAAVRVGLETGQLSNWLTLNLRRCGLPVLSLDARYAKAAFSMQINKTDANDALGLAQIVPTGWYREVAVKSMDANTLKNAAGGALAARLVAPDDRKHHPGLAYNLRPGRCPPSSRW
jgi:transposase